MKKCYACNFLVEFDARDPHVCNTCQDQVDEAVKRIAKAFDVPVEFLELYSKLKREAKICHIIT